MKVQYIGLFDEIEIPEFPDEQGFGRTVKRGESVEIPDELAERMLEQAANWRKSVGGKVPEYGVAAESPLPLRTSEGTGKRMRGKKVTLGETATLRGDGSGVALPPIESPSEDEPDTDATKSED